MTEESAADRQAAQQAREQEKKYGDSATAVSPDTQRADPGAATDAGSTTGESARGESTVFDEPDQDAEPPAQGYGERPERVTGAQDGATGSTGEDQDAEPSQPPYDGK